MYRNDPNFTYSETEKCTKCNEYYNYTNEGLEFNEEAICGDCLEHSRKEISHRWNYKILEKILLKENFDPQDIDAVKYVLEEMPEEAPDA